MEMLRSKAMDPKDKLKQAERVLIWMSDSEFWEFMRWCEENKEASETFSGMLELWAEYQTAVIQ